MFQTSRMIPKLQKREEPLSSPSFHHCPYLHASDPSPSTGPRRDQHSGASQMLFSDLCFAISKGHSTRGQSVKLDKSLLGCE